MLESAAPEKRAFSEEEAASPAPSSTDNTVNSGSNGSSKKRRTGASTGEGRGTVTGTSSRGVANLTPDQLAKKRANDREAQRAIRERTKNQIETLEKRIRELTAQQPYQELQHVLRQKEQVESENREIKKRLLEVMGLIQPVLQQRRLEAAPYPPQNQPYLPTLSITSSHHNGSTGNGVPSPATLGSGSSQWQAPEAQMDHASRNYPQIQYSQNQQLMQQRHEMTHNLDMGVERLGLDFLLDGTQHITKIPNGIPAVPELQNHTSIPRGSDSESPIHHRGSSSSHGYPASTPTSEVSGHSAPIRNGPPTCPFDNLLLDFLKDRQQQAAEGIRPPTLIGPAYPSVSSLLNPTRSAHSHPLSKVFTDFLSTFPDLTTLPEKVAVLYMMFLVMRWQIAPTQENYDRLPEWMTPRPSQLFTPHPAWIDHLPWPKMRDRLVTEYNPRDYLFDNFCGPFTATLNLSWPYEPTDALLKSNDGEELLINPVFERHLRKLENWSLGPAFANAFPGLVDTYRLKMDGDRRL